MNPQQTNSYLPVYEYIPEKWEDGRIIIVEALKRISNAVNNRVIGSLFTDYQATTGKNIFIDGVSYDVYSQVVRTGALPNIAASTIAHGINIDSNFRLLNMYGTAMNTTTLQGFSYVYDQSGGSQEISLSYTSTDVVITSTIDLSAYNDGFVTMEYFWEN